jgi:hypothetical protein
VPRLDLSRLSRDAAEMLRLARLLEYARITLISVADGIETGTKLSKLTLSVKAIFNEQYLDDLRERVLRGMQGRFARGLHTGGRIYGYRSVPVVDPSGRVDPGGQPLILGMELVIEPDVARIVRQIFEWFVAGVSMRAIAHRLNDQAVAFPAAPTRRGAKRKGWAISAVRVILLNDKYRGQWIFGRRIFFKDPVSGRRRARQRPKIESSAAMKECLEHHSKQIGAEVKNLEASFRDVGIATSAALVGLSVPTWATKLSDLTGPAGPLVVSAGIVSVAMLTVTKNLCDYYKSRRSSPWSYVLSLRRGLRERSFARALASQRLTL